MECFHYDPRQLNGASVDVVRCTDSSTWQWIIHYDIGWFTRSQFLNCLFNIYNQHIALYSRQSHPDTLLIFFSTFKIGQISFFCYLILTIESLCLFYLCLHKLPGTHWSCQYWNFRHLTKTRFDPSLNLCIYPTKQIVSLIYF